MSEGVVVLMAVARRLTTGQRDRESERKRRKREID